MDHLLSLVLLLNFYLVLKNMIWLWTSHHHFLFGCPYAVDSYLSCLDRHGKNSMVVLMLLILTSYLDRHGKNSNSCHCLPWIYIHHIKDIL